MRIIGDIHEYIDAYRDLLPDNDSSIQIGDMGLGFPGVYLPELPKQHRFFRGNHDDPEACREHPNYAVDYGYLPEHGIYIVAGGESFDKQMLRPYISWWPDEELSPAQFEEALQEYAACQPKVMLSHEGPQSIVETLFPRVKTASATRLALQAMLELHAPDLWCFGHHHVDRRVTVGKTEFYCVGERSYLDYHWDENGKPQVDFHGRGR